MIMINRLFILLIGIAFVGCNHRTSLSCGNAYESNVLNRVHCGKFFIENYKGLEEAMSSDTIIFASKIERTSNFCSFHFQKNTIRVVDYTTAKKEVIELEGIEYDSHEYANISYNGLFVIDENTMSISLSKIHQDGIEINMEDTISVSKAVERPIETSKTYEYTIEMLKNNKKTNYCKVLFLRKE